MRYLLHPSIDLSVVIVLAACNAAFWSALALLRGPAVGEMLTPVILMNLPRATLVVWAGAVVVANGGGSLCRAAQAGALLFFVEHVVVAGLFFLLARELLAVGGLVISYVMFVWVAMLLGMLGGWFGRAAFRPAAQPPAGADGA